MKLLGIAGVISLVGVILLFIGVGKATPLNIFVYAVSFCLILGAILTAVYRRRSRAKTIKSESQKGKPVFRDGWGN